MRDWLRTVRLMVAISLRSDPVRSVVVLLSTTLQLASMPLRAVGTAMLANGIAAHNRDRAVTGVIVIVGFNSMMRLMNHTSFTMRMRLRENTQLYLDSHIMGLTAGIPGLEHHERPEYLDNVELIRAERSYLANPFNPISWTVANVIQLVSVLALLAGVHPVLVLLPLAGVPSAIATGRAEREYADLREQQAQPNRILRHYMELTTEAPAAKEVRIYGLTGELLSRRRRLFDELEHPRLAVAYRQLAVTSAAWLFFALSYVAALAWTVHLVTTGRANVGAAVLVLSLGSQINQQLADLADNVTWFVATQRAVRRLVWFTRYADDAHRAVTPVEPAPVPDVLRTGIEFSDVSFAYPGTSMPVLAGVDLLLPAGSTVAIVGENGAGKTTLMKLLCRFYEPSSGTITIDGVHLRDIDIDEWRLRTSAGFQDFAKLQLLARETVGVGSVAHADDDDHLLGALDRAAATDVLDVLPSAFETQLGRDFENGVEISIGQWQKLALGRAMMRPEPLLLILDEPTASLDAQTEHQLFERFHGAARDLAVRTGAITILISHRFSTVRMADLILVIDQGRIVEAGSHEELVSHHGLYTELYQLQAGAYRR